MRVDDVSTLPRLKGFLRRHKPPSNLHYNTFINELPVVGQTREATFSLTPRMFIG